MKEPITVPNKEQNDADQPQLGHPHRQDHPNDRGNPAGKLADAELHFSGESSLAGLKLIGFSIWERRGGNGRNVTFPARQYSVNGERRSFALLRPVVDTTAQTPCATTSSRRTQSTRRRRRPPNVSGPAAERLGALPFGAFVRETLRR